MSSGSLPVVAIAGRPNVGKSTLFNRLVGRRVAIVDDRPGVTRDSVVVKAKLGGRACYLADTGGLTGDTRKRGIDADVEKQILRSIAGADVIVLVTDCSGGIVQDDIFVAGVIRRAGRQVVLVANKADSPERIQRMSSDIYELGYGEPLPVSALLGRNLAALGERVAALLPETETEDMKKRVNFCVVGRPNVGKSSIVNATLGQERCVVSSVPGTTRDSIAADFSWGGAEFTIVDTAGQRRRKSNLDDVEFYSITRARESIRASDVAVLVIDAVDGLLEGDKRIAAAVLEARRGFLIVVNKMDLVDADQTELFVKHLASEAPFLRNTPVVFVSALMAEGMDIVLENIADVHERMNTRLPNELLENVIYDVRALFSPKAKGRSSIGAIRAVLHDRVDPPRVIIKVDDKTVFSPAYIRMIENRLREVFNLAGVPIDIVVADGEVFALVEPQHGPAKEKPGRAKPERKIINSQKAPPAKPSKPAKKKFTPEKAAPKSAPKKSGKTGAKGARKTAGRGPAKSGGRKGARTK